VSVKRDAQSGAVTLHFPGIGIGGGLRSATKAANSVGILNPQPASRLRGFEVKQGGVFRSTAAARGANDTVVVQPVSGGPGRITAVRYAWQNAPSVTLHGSDVLPSGHFERKVSWKGSQTSVTRRMFDQRRQLGRKLRAAGGEEGRMRSVGSKRR